MGFPPQLAWSFFLLCLICRFAIAVPVSEFDDVEYDNDDSSPARFNKRQQNPLMNFQPSSKFFIPRHNQNKRSSTEDEAEGPLIQVNSLLEALSHLIEISAQKLSSTYAQTSTTPNHRNPPVVIPSNPNGGLAVKDPVSFSRSFRSVPTYRKRSAIVEPSEEFDRPARE